MWHSIYRCIDIDIDMVYGVEEYMVYGIYYAVRAVLYPRDPSIYMIPITLGPKVCT